MQDELLFSKLRVAEMLHLRFLGLLAAGVHDCLDSFWVDANHWLDLLGLARLRELEVSTLSGGERRRLEIASIMLANPGVLLMDEPTASLDPSNAETVYSAVWGVRGTRTVVIATHEALIPGLPESAHELYLDNGRVREGCAAG
jgi:energy-coupling factor transporter ATP-binding protein EcfA2